MDFDLDWKEIIIGIVIGIILTLLIKMKFNLY